MTALLLIVAAVASLAVAAFCAGAETGFLSLSPGRVIHMAREGGRRAKIIEKAISDMCRTTNALLVGNNLAGVSYSSAVAALVAMYYRGSRAAETAASVASAMLLLCLGEFLPKLFYSAKPLRRMLKLAPWWRAFSRVFGPAGALVQLLVERMLPRRRAQRAKMSPETVLQVLQDRKEGVKLSDFESALIGRIMVLRSRGRPVDPETLLSAIDSDVV
ncbi:MAG: DUF21 domain-containing protein [Kiritimatiellae bacterium]|nr:DUF21 domain-containing protein [Kiritimatiellia bacterium]